MLSGRVAAGIKLSFPFPNYWMVVVETAKKSVQLPV